MLVVSLLGVGTVLRLERDAWSMVSRPRQATCEYAPSPNTAMHEMRTPPPRRTPPAIVYSCPLISRYRPIFFRASGVSGRRSCYHIRCCVGAVSERHVGTYGCAGGAATGQGERPLLHL